MSLTPPDEIELSPGRIVCDPKRREWLEARGYLSIAGPRDDDARHVFHRSSRRENARRDDGPDGQVLYDKRLLGWRNRNSGLNEWAVLRHAMAHGVRVAQPWAAGTLRRNGNHEAFLVTAELCGNALPNVVRQRPNRSRAIALARSVGRALAALHDANITFPSAFAKHVIVGEGAGHDEDIGFIDLADARIKSPSRNDRARDLGALAVTLPCWPVSRGLRLTALRAYLAAVEDPGWELRDAWLDVGRAAARRQRRRRYRVNLTGSPTSPLTLEARGDGTWVFAEESHVLAAAGGLDALSTTGPERESDGERVTVRGPRDLVWRWQRILQMLHAFDVPAPVPIATRLDGDHGVLLRQDRPVSAPANSASVHAWTELFRRLLRAGLVPRPGFGEVTRLEADGRIYLAEPALAQPPVVTPRVSRRVIKAARAELRAVGVPPATVRDVMARLRPGS
ncbi:MAG: hypothetical protein HRU14_01950 [Planctomycetes bacterium]|nr:hypothetical protein [Planctomycetota bacterium]